MRDVVFDLGGVLVDWDPRYLLRDALCGEAAAVETFLATVCTPEWHAQLDAGGSFAALTRELAGRHPEHAAWIESYAQGWERMFAGDLLETVRHLQSLRARGYRLHALSNYPAERIRFLYRRFPFMAAFDTVVISGLVRAVKPHRPIFDYLLERIGHRDCIFVDDREENVAAARSCGLRAVHFVRGGLGLARLEQALADAEAGAPGGPPMGRSALKFSK